MRTKFAILATTLAALIGSLVVVSTAAAYLYPAHCGWSTDGTFHYSPAYNIYYRYSGHNGNNARRYDEYNASLTEYFGTALVNC